MEFLQLIISKIPAHVFIKNEAGQFLACSDFLARDAGFQSARDIIGKTDFDLPWAAYAKKYRQDDELVLASEKEAIEVEEYFLNKHGQKAIIKVSKIAIKLPDGSKAVLGFHNGIDSKSEGSTALLEDIINYIPHDIFWKNKEGIFVGCNKHFAKAAGYSDPSELIGKTDYEMPWHEHADKYREDDKLIMQEGKPRVDIEDAQTRKDGTEIVALVSKVPLFDSKNEVAGVLGIYSDITDRKKRELELAEQKKLAEVASRAKSEFISNISHDIRTPISGMLGLIHSIKTRVQDKEIREDADLLMESTHKLLDLLNEILEIVRLESKKKVLSEEVFNLDELIQNNFMLLRPAVKNQGIKVISIYPKELTHYFFGNRLLVNRILMNLLGNAAKFTEEGEIVVTVSRKQEDEKIAEYEISVKDTGIGIPSDKFAEIFEHFSRLTPAYQGIYEGSGMGLYTVKRYLEELGGTVRVESELGKGSIFTVQLPLKKASAEQIELFTHEKKEAKLAENLQKEIYFKNVRRKILVVEDQLLASRMATRLLQELNCDVENASNAKEAMALIEQNEYSLILMDIGLPDGDGASICSKVRAMPDEKKAKTPIVGLTAHLDSQIEKTCKRVGMQCVITKPLTLQTTKEILQEYT